LPVPLFHGILSSMTDLLERITQEDGKCGGRPCIRGMRIRVMDVLDLLAGGASRADILRDYPLMLKMPISPPVSTPSRGLRAARA
jgi:uncharacterized protein (DUF433 family)